MNVAIEARALAAGGGGVKLYVQELLTALAKLAPSDITVIRARDSAHHIPHIREVTVPLRHDVLLPFWLNYQIPRHLQQSEYTVVHFTKAAIPRRPPAGTVVTIYDLIPLLFPAGQSPLRRRYWPKTLRHAAVASDHIITISQQSKKDIVEHLAVDPEKVTVTPLAAAPQLARVTESNALASICARYAMTKPYLLFVGTLEPRKNVPALIRAFSAVAAEIPHQLVIAGRSSWGSAAVQRAQDESAYKDRIHILNEVATSDLPALYSGADLFVWPSLYEGWGLPPLEALACGTRVIVSDGGSLPEVVGKVGHVVPFTVSDITARRRDVEFERSLSAAIKQTLAEPDTPHEQANRARHARIFSWQRVAETTHQVYQQVQKRRHD